MSHLLQGQIITHLQVYTLQNTCLVTRWGTWWLKVTVSETLRVSKTPSRGLSMAMHWLIYCPCNSNGGQRGNHTNSSTIKCPVDLHEKF